MHVCVCVYLVYTVPILFIFNKVLKKISHSFALHIFYFKNWRIFKTLNIRMTPRDHMDEPYMNCRYTSHVILRRCWLSICLIFQATGNSLLNSGLVHSGIFYWRDNNYFLLIWVTVLVYKIPLNSNFFYFIF